MPLQTLVFRRRMAVPDRLVGLPKELHLCALV